MATLILLAFLVPLDGLAAAITISQVYGGGGNIGSTLTNDYVELYNPTSGAVDLTGWTIQYAPAAGSTWQMTALSGSIAAFSYYLVQEAQGAGGTTPLPTPDASGTISMSATAAKLALVSNATLLSGTCPSGGAIVDFVGYGTANCYEGTAAAPTLSNTTAAIRLSGGFRDTNDNSADFAVGSPDPRNSASAPNMPIPEPGTSVLTLLGLSVLALVVSRKCSRSAA